jgi:hypothetical protein
MGRIFQIHEIADHAHRDGLTDELVGHANLSESEPNESRHTEPTEPARQHHVMELHTPSIGESSP